LSDPECAFDYAHEVDQCAREDTRKAVEGTTCQKPYEYFLGKRKEES
jgi:hypothetical protein